MEILLGIIGWLALGVAGVATVRKRWFEIFGDYEDQEWTNGLNLFSILLGPATLLAAIIYYYSPRKY